jgi:hypothetical protein
MQKNLKREEKHSQRQETSLFARPRLGAGKPSAETLSSQPTSG